MSVALQRLRAEIASDARAFGERVDELAGLDLATPDPAICARAAVALHHAYGAIEATLARTARALEGDAAGGGDWHQALLHAMTLEIPTVRPRILSNASAAALRRLLAFRHFFRHAYAAPLDVAQLATLRDEVVAARAAIDADLTGLDQFLAALATPVGQTPR